METTANPYIQSYLSDTSIPAENRRNMANDLNSGKIDEAKAQYIIINKYPQHAKVERVVSERPAPGLGERLISKSQEGINTAMDLGVKGAGKLGEAIGEKLYPGSYPGATDPNKIVSGITDVGTGAVGAVFSPIGAAISEVPVAGKVLESGMSQLSKELEQSKQMKKQEWGVQDGTPQSEALDSLYGALEILGPARLGEVTAPYVGKGLAKTGELAKKGSEFVSEKTSPLIKGGVEAVKEAIKPKPLTPEQIAVNTQKLNSLSGMVAQGKKVDAAKAAKAYSDIDSEGIKTYEDLKTSLDTRIQEVSHALDSALSTNKTKTKLSELGLNMKAGEEVVTHNYVDDALSHLEEMYKATNDPVMEANIKQLRLKAEEGGMTVKDINDLAKIHGSEFKQKAFSKNGDQLTSVNAQAFENTRKGLKDTARSLFGNEAYALADTQVSNLIRARELAKTMEEKVNVLKQKIQERGLGAQAAHIAINLINQLSGGTVKAAVAALLPRGVGYKVFNALDLEVALRKNLKKIQDLGSKNLSESDVIKGLKDIVHGSDPQAASQLKTTNAAKTAKNVPIDPTIPPKGGKSSFKSPTVGETGLIQEAKKYKSAEEFVNSKEIVYHGTPHDFENFDLGKAGTATDSGMFGKGFYFTNNATEAYQYSRGSGIIKEAHLDMKNPYIINSAKDIPKIDVPNSTIEELKAADKNYSENFTKHLKDLGYDGVIDNMHPDMKQYIVFDKSQIKTKSQLTDIYNQAHGK